MGIGNAGDVAATGRGPKIEAEPEIFWIWGFGTFWVFASKLVRSSTVETSGRLLLYDDCDAVTVSYNCFITLSCSANCCLKSEISSDSALSRSRVFLACFNMSSITTPIGEREGEKGSELWGGMCIRYGVYNIKCVCVCIHIH